MAIAEDDDRPRYRWQVVTFERDETGAARIDSWVAHEAWTRDEGSLSICDVGHDEGTWSPIALYASGQWKTLTRHELDHAELYPNAKESRA